MSQQQQQLQQQLQQQQRAFDVAFRVDDTPYGSSVDPNTRGRIFVPQIANEGVSLHNAAAGIFCRASKDSNEIITVAELHRRHLAAAKRAAPSDRCISIEQARVEAMDGLRSAYTERIVKQEGGFSVVPNESFNRWIFESLVWETEAENFGSSRSSTNGNNNNSNHSNGTSILNSLLRINSSPVTAVALSAESSLQQQQDQQQQQQQPQHHFNPALRDPLIPTALRISPSLMREMRDDQSKQQTAVAALPPLVFDTLCAGIAIKTALLGLETASKLHAEQERIRCDPRRRDTVRATLVTAASLEKMMRNGGGNNNSSSKNTNNSKTANNNNSTPAIPVSPASPAPPLADDVAVISCGDIATHEILLVYAEKFRRMFAAFNNNNTAAASSNNNNTIVDVAVVAAKPQQQQQRQGGGRHQNNQQQNQHNQQNPQQEQVLLRKAAEEDEQILESRIFCMLQRYRALARGPNRERAREGSGHHSATPPPVLNKLRDLVGASMECFASPYNSHWPYFCSAFRDTDSFFGSIGSFFDFWPVEGSLEVGPPFVEEVMEQMRVHIVRLLRSSDRPLSFVTICPNWVTEADGMTIRTSPPPSPSLTKLWTNADGFTRMRLNVVDHVFMDGFQHTYRRALFRPPNPTFVAVLQNEAGARRWPVSEATTGETIKAVWAISAAGVAQNTFRASKTATKESGE